MRVGVRLQEEGAVCAEGQGRLEQLRVMGNMVGLRVTSECWWLPWIRGCGAENLRQDQGQMQRTSEDSLYLCPGESWGR